MPRATPQELAIVAASNLTTLFKSLRDGREAYGTLTRSIASNDYATMWAQLPTAALTADGSIGQADESPNPAHPITAGNLNVSTNLLNDMTTLLADLADFLAQNNRNATIDKVVG